MQVEQDKIKKAHRVRTLVMALLLAGLTAAGMGCGKKGPPLLPLGVELPPPAPVRIHVNQDRVVVDWPVYSPAPGGIRSEGVAVYRARRSLSDTACRDCPLGFERVADIAPGVGRYAGSVEPGYRYFFRLKRYADKDVYSENSETVQVDAGSNF